MASKISHRSDADNSQDKYLFIHICDVWNVTANKELKWRTPSETLHGETPDISWLRFQWWQPIWYYEDGLKYPESRMLPG
eukprot:10333622-Ditylum_brightwellii.AAC.1